MACGLEDLQKKAEMANSCLSKRYAEQVNNLYYEMVFFYSIVIRIIKMPNTQKFTKFGVFTRLQYSTFFILFMLC